MNGYYRLCNNEKGICVELVPPTNGGEAIRVNEIREYIGNYSIPFDQDRLNKALLEAKEKRTLCLLSPGQLKPVAERMVADVTADKMHAFVRFFPPSDGGKCMTSDEIISKLKLYRVVQGIDHDILAAIVKEKNYCTDYEIATGKLQTAGTDARIEYHFNVNPSLRPALKEDGSVDFFQLNNMNHCEVGDVLAEIIPSCKGENGYDVYGNVLLAREVKEVSFKFSRNIHLSEDGKQLISEVSGHVQLVEGTVFASDVYVVENVDTSTGNVEYNGNIQINGNVCDNFSVKASGDIQINGVVEAAKVESGGNVTIVRGIHGQGKAELKAKGNVISKFIESAKVTAGGFVETEAILHSQVDAGTEVNVESKKGFITGGRVHAGSSIRVKNVGSNMGTDTVLHVGIDPMEKERFGVLQKTMQEREKAIRQIQPTLVASAQKIQAGEKMNAAQIQYIQQLQAALKEQKAGYDADKEEYERLRIAVENASGACIEVSGNMFGGTRVMISGSSLVIKDSIKYCKLVRENAEVKMKSF